MLRNQIRSIIFSIMNYEKNYQKNNVFLLLNNYCNYIRLINIDKNIDIIRRIYLKMFILILWSSRFLYLYFIGIDRSFEWRVVNFDWINMAKIDNMLNLYLASFGLLLAYYTYIIYFHNNTRATQLIFRILINGDLGFFIRKKSSSSSSSINEQIVNVDQRQKFVRQIRLWLNVYYQIFHSLYLVTYMLAIIAEIQVMNFFMKNGYFSTCSGIIGIITQSVHLIFVVIGSIISLDILFLFGSCFLSITMISFTKFEQIKKKCLKQNQKSKIMTKKIINEIRNRTIQILFYFMPNL
uniref:Uncharacterized protein LOC113790890 n=1 Tax=Dermatophagoides pteronyssinus TaxID=6956 RepID=A0A6P6XWV6_DERPT|nr:uncharacterized protein LOC113790890 [Dermatophagoides pteronyssinus]